MGAGWKFDHADANAQRDASADPGPTTFERGEARLDVLDMLLLRRRWKADRLNDNVIAVNLYSDSSPVTGSELQGMVMDITRRIGDPSRITLPGATLFYGNYSALAKGVVVRF